jgi:hypothetical protein
MEFKGTKEKWFIDNEESHIMTNGIYCNVISTEKTISLADVYGDDEEAQANALLISKAPEMLEMLQSVLKLQKENYGNGMKTHVAMITKSKEIEQLIKEATEI